MSKKEQKPESKEQRQERASESSMIQLQLVEQALQGLLMQKQAFQFEYMETNNALEELKKTKADGEVYKIVGSLMFKSNKAELEKELERKRDVINLRLKTIEKQEEELKNKLLSHRDDLLKSLKK